MGNRKSYFKDIRKLFLLIFFSLLTACKSVPVIYNAAEMEFFPLDSGASVYIIANTKQARPILDLLPLEELKEKQTADLLDRTDSFVAALFPPESGKRFQLAAMGNYPSFRAGIAFTFDRKWKQNRMESGDAYWYSQESGLSIAMNSNQAFVVSSLTGTPAEPVSAPPGMEIPPDFGDFNRGAPLSCWLTDPAPALAGILNNAGIPLRVPVQQLFINLYPSDDGKSEALIRMQFENVSLSRGAAAVFGLAAAFAPAGNSLTAIFLSNPPVQNDRYLDIRTATLNERDISLLFSLFFNYLH